MIARPSKIKRAVVRRAGRGQPLCGALSGAPGPLARTGAPPRSPSWWRCWSGAKPSIRDANSEAASSGRIEPPAGSPSRIDVAERALSGGRTRPAASRRGPTRSSVLRQPQGDKIGIGGHAATQPQRGQCRGTPQVVLREPTPRRHGLPRRGAPRAEGAGSPAPGAAELPASAAERRGRRPPALAPVKSARNELRACRSLPARRPGTGRWRVPAKRAVGVCAAERPSRVPGRGGV